MSKENVYIIACSGIGKVFGSMGREAAYILVNELKKGETELTCLPLIVKGKVDLIEELKESPVITIDGCPLKCAYNDVSAAGISVNHSTLSTEIIKEHRAIRPEKEVYPMGQNAKILSRKLAEKVALKVDEILASNSEDHQQ